MNKFALPPIELAWLKEVLAKEVLKGHWRMPRKSDLQELVAKLNLVQRKYCSLVNTRDLHGDYETLNSALKILADLGPSLIDSCYMRVGAEKTEGKIRELQFHLSKASLLIDMSIGNEVFLFGYSSQRGGRWKFLAFDVAKLLSSALAEANPNRDLGFSAGGPASRFVHLLIPRMTGEAPKLESVSAELKKAAREDRNWKKGTQALGSKGESEAHDADLPLR